MKFYSTILVIASLLSSAAAEEVKSPKCSGEFPMSMCRAFFKRWTFDETENICKEAVWGGCPTPDDDANFFQSEADCEATCL